MTAALGVVVSGGAPEQVADLVGRLVAEGIDRVAVVGPFEGSISDPADALHSAIDRLRRGDELPDAVVLLDGTIEIGPGFSAGLAGALASDDRLVIVTGNQGGGGGGGVEIVEDGGVPTGGSAVRGSWFEQGYRFPRGCTRWFGLDDLVLDVRAAGGLVGVASDLPMHVPDPMEGVEPGDFGPVNQWAAERDVFWSRRGADVAAAAEAATVRALGRPVPTSPSVPMQVINLARRPDRLLTFRRGLADRAGAEVADLVERREAVDALDLVPSAELRAMVVPNHFGSRRTTIACALSHLSLWTDAAQSGRPATLVWEDDTEPVPGFLAALEQLLDQAAGWEGGWDVIMLDYTPAVHDRSDLWSTRAQRLQPMRWDHYRGGLYGYLLSARGAERLVDMVARHGLDHEIDICIREHGLELTTLEVRPPIVSQPFPMVESSPDSDIEHDDVALF